MNEAVIKIITTNRKAYHEYSISDKWEAGIVLSGTEVKSVRAGKINLNDGWVDIDSNGEAYLREVNVSPYTHGNIMNHLEKRPRKLLLKRNEINKISQLISVRGMSIIPLKAYFKGQLIKIEIGLGRGKKLHDKREDSKKRDANLEMSRALKHKR